MPDDKKPGSNPADKPVSGNGDLTPGEKYDPSADPQTEAHKKRMEDLFGDLDEDDEGNDIVETVETLRAERDTLAAQVDRLKNSVSRTRKENSALMEKVNAGKDALQEIENLRGEDKKVAAKRLLVDLAPVATQLEEGLKEISAEERAANPKLNTLTVGVEKTVSQLSAVFNKYGIDPKAPPAIEAPAVKEEKPAAPEADKPAQPANDGSTTPPAVIVKADDTLESLKAERAQLLAEVSSLTSTVSRAQSDNLTLTRRIEEGKQILVREEAARENDKQWAAEKPLKDLMPVIDTLEAGLKLINNKARQEDPNFDLLAKTVEGTLKSINATFNKHGIRQNNPVNQPFDDERHEAVTTAVVPGVEPGMVVQVVQKGYELNGRIVRNAKVVVTPDDM
jgi:molecular chaperone GrpE